jgi:hypothetical protein
LLCLLPSYGIAGLSGEIFNEISRFSSVDHFKHFQHSNRGKRRGVRRGDWQIIEHPIDSAPRFKGQWRSKRLAQPGLPSSENAREET